ncbi:MAG: SCP2 sterol-binding domain-containing protein [Candidatus Helarchaeales archaeon]
MDEIKAMVEKIKDMPKDELVKEIPNIIEKAKAVGFLQVAKEVPDMAEVIRSKMAEFDVDEAIELIKKFMPVMFDAMKEFAEQNEDIQEELEDTEDVAISMVVEDGDFAMTFIVKDGKFDYKLEQVPDADLVMKMPKEVMANLMAGEGDPMQAYMSGDIKAEGNLAKAMALRSIFEIMGDEFGFNLMG